MLNALRWIALAAAIVLFAAACGVVYYSSALPTTPEKQQATEKNDQAPAESKYSKLFWNRVFPDTISFFTFWLGLFTGALALVAFLQLNSLNRAEIIAATTAKAAKDSADVARDAVKLSDKTAERQLRAYVNNVSTIIRNVEVGKVPEVRVEIKNWGRTPAYRVRHTGSYTLAVFPWSGTTSQPPYQSESTLGPGSNSFMPLKGHTLAPEHVAGLNDGSLAIYIEGSITYKMTGRLGERLEKVERAVCSRPLHLIACENMAEVAEATRFLGDRFGDLIFVATGVRHGRTETERRGEWLFQARHNSVVRPRP